MRTVRLWCQGVGVTVRTPGVLKSAHLWASASSLWNGKVGANYLGSPFQLRGCSFVTPRAMLRGDLRASSAGTRPPRGGRRRPPSRPYLLCLTRGDPRRLPAPGAPPGRAPRAGREHGRRSIHMRWVQNSITELFPSYYQILHNQCLIERKTWFAILKG